MLLFKTFICRTYNCGFFFIWSCYSSIVGSKFYLQIQVILLVNMSTLYNLYGLQKINSMYKLQYI